MPIGNARRAAETFCRGCGIGRTEKYYRVNSASPGLQLCRDCAAGLNPAREIKGKTREWWAEVLADMPGGINYAIGEQPRKYCAGCIDCGKHPIFAPL